MKHSTCTLIISFALLLPCIAQPGFNKIFKSAYPKGELYDMIVHNDTIIGYGVAFSDTVEWKQGLLLVKIDSSGNLLTSNLVLAPEGDFYSIHYFWGKIAATPGGGYAMTAAPFYSNSAVLIKTDADLEVEFVKEYGDTVNLSNYRYEIMPIEDGYLLYGAIQRTNFQDNAFVRKVDSLGETIWFNYYGAYEDDGAMLDVQPIDGQTVVAASVDQTGNNGSRSTLRIIDLDGNVLKSWASGPDPEVGYFRKVMVLPDGAGFLTYGVRIVQVIDPNNRIAQPAIARFDADLGLQWVKHYGKKYNFSAAFEYFDIEPTIDGGYIAAGRNDINLPNDIDPPTGSLLKFTADGDSLWSRYDTGPYSVSYINNHFFGGVGVLSSGNIIAGGTATLGMDNNLWLVKVTNDGCMDTIMCEPITGIVERAQKEKEVMKFYPNPASQSVTVELPSALEAVEISIYDLQGRAVSRQTFRDAPAKVEWPTGHLPTGIYILTAQCPGGILGQGKLVIQQ
ncbi:MAG: T9SS type A sorting domain-containing protein [Saprospiraceae bacterium]